MQDMDIVKAIYKMNNIQRFSGRKLINAYTVGEHTFRVISLSMLIVDHYNLENKKKIDPLTVMRKATIHDLEESLTGDLPSPIKKVGGLRTKLREVCEIIMKDYILSKLPNALKLLYFNLWEKDKDEETGEIIKIADKLEGLLVCYYEVKRGNEDLKETFIRELKWFQSEENILLLKKYTWAKDQYNKILDYYKTIDENEKKFLKEIKLISKKRI